MSALDPWLAAVHGFQALRRQVERECGAMLGAMGVAAEPLPHQLGNVSRVLEATEIRHLLADGVGLGKTIQTLMIVNALRLADPGHRTLLVAPDHLVLQWTEEFSTRGHLSVAVKDREEEDDRAVLLVRPTALIEDREMLQTGPDRFDLLVLDEPQTYTVEQRDALGRARPFTQFLALTATPGFGTPALRAWLFRMIEPARTALAELSGEEPLAWIEADEARAAEQIGTGDVPPALGFDRNALGRRICRWSRADWPDYAPKRRYSRDDIAPFERETYLATVAARLMAQHVQTTETGEHDRRSGVDSIRRAQALHRLGRSSRDALADVPNSIREEGDTNGDEIFGDARFDALLDHLGKLWRRDPEARVLLVAGDNPTIDRLESRLPSYFSDPTTGEPLSLGSFARGRSATDAEDAIRNAHERLTEFIRGDERILLIGEWAQAGLNLHHSCSELIFYSCPWDLRSIDQLIGRLDRLRRDAERRALDQQDQGEVGIHVITWAETSEARMVDGLERLGVFERPAPPASVETEQEVTRLLHRLAANRDVAASLDALDALGDDTAFEAALSTLAPASPYRADAARSLYRKLLEAETLPGGLSTGRKVTGARGSEEDAMVGWLDSLGATQTFDIRWGLKDEEDDTLRFSTAWYAVTGERLSDETKPAMIELFERRFESQRYANITSGIVAFNAKRHHLPQPPRSQVATRFGGKVLQFFDHGDELHEQFCAAFLHKAMSLLEGSLQQVIVSYPENHPALEERGPRLLTIARTVVDIPDASSAEISAALEDADPRDRTGVKRGFFADLAADDRWLIFRRPPRLEIAASRWTDDQAESCWRAVTPDVALSVLDPRSPDQKHRPAKFRRVLRALPMSARKTLPAEARHQRQTLLESAQSRLEPKELAARVDLLETETERRAAVAEKRAAQHRARVSDDPNQRRIEESRAARIESYSRAEQRLHALRVERLNRAASNMGYTCRDCWQIVIQPVPMDAN